MTAPSLALQVCGKSILFDAALDHRGTHRLSGTAGQAKRGVDNSAKLGYDAYIARRTGRLQGDHHGLGQPE